MATKRVIALGLVMAAAAVCAQTPVEAPEWVETAAPPPPPYATDRLIPIEMPPYVTLKIGIDPNTLAVGADGVVRYVVVMRNASGSVNAAYEGILCSNGEVKTYARTDSAGNWVLAAQPQWRGLTDNLPSRHALALAKQGACDGHTAARPANIIATLRRGQKSYD